MEKAWWWGRVICYDRSRKLDLLIGGSWKCLVGTRSCCYREVGRYLGIYSNVMLWMFALRT